MHGNGFSSPVLVALAGHEASPITLVAFPGGGNGPSAFAPWIPHVPSGWRLVAVCLPGRSHRIGEDMPPDLPGAAADTAAAINAEITGRVVLFGHSMGALLAFEVARRVQAELLAVAACTPPDKPKDYSVLDHAAIQALVSEQLAATRISDQVMLDELAAHAASTLRADLAMLDSYAAPEVLLGCPVVAYYGASDDMPHIPWTMYTSASAAIVPLPGDHQFCHADPGRILADLSARLRPWW